ncbi:hypothetical protein LPB79_13695 [Rhizobium sp. T136]|uniref:Uncharacterized protein n=1 Tax=Rhizobium favelukesii TaxID=348824 RepID=W6RFM8_9HYPH|nr:MULTISPECIES: hypothetical protein [Rhizobium]MCS0461125.1 hypothetical protein [Rhizobium favelukesii]UFS83298.1 hypothetical protein LPB79_13695 [Rhizobium sp. T136]CDM59135.1 hypothetical protein LPU83_3491 [Rhizobium favelukesii]
MSTNILTVDDSASIRLTTKGTLTNAVTEAVNGAPARKLTADEWASS